SEYDAWGQEFLSPDAYLMPHPNTGYMPGQPYFLPPAEFAPYAMMPHYPPPIQVAYHCCIYFSFLSNINLCFYSNFHLLLTMVSIKLPMHNRPILITFQK